MDCKNFLWDCLNRGNYPPISRETAEEPPVTESTPNKLWRWMRDNRYSDPLFAAEISRRQPKPVTPKTVFNWRHGIRVPRSASMSTIMAITDNQVTPNDFVRAA
jgi:hypothetical protein